MSETGHDDECLSLADLVNIVFGGQRMMPDREMPLFATTPEPLGAAQDTE